MWLLPFVMKISSHMSKVVCDVKQVCDLVIVWLENGALAMTGWRILYMSWNIFSLHSFLSTCPFPKQFDIICDFCNRRCVVFQVAFAVIILLMPSEIYFFKQSLCDHLWMFMFWGEIRPWLSDYCMVLQILSWINWPCSEPVVCRGRGVCTRFYCFEAFSFFPHTRTKVLLFAFLIIYIYAEAAVTCIDHCDAVSPCTDCSGVCFSSSY